MPALSPAMISTSVSPILTTASGLLIPNFWAAVIAIQGAGRDGKSWGQAKFSCILEIFRVFW